jgi:hypothetical protein
LDKRPRKKLNLLMRFIENSAKMVANASEQNIQSVFKKLTIPEVAVIIFCSYFNALEKFKICDSKRILKLQLDKVSISGKVQSENAMGKLKA